MHHFFSGDVNEWVSTEGKLPLAGSGGLPLVVQRIGRFCRLLLKSLVIFDLTFQSICEDPLDVIYCTWMISTLHYQNWRVLY